MKYLGCRIGLVCVTLLSICLPLQAMQYHSFLRINKAYILYTAPIVPHADKQGNFWVGLAPMALLLGAKLTEGTNGSATMTFRGHALAFQAGTVSATLDGQVLRLPVSAKRIGPANQMVVPLGAVLSSFGLHSSWNKRYHTLTLTNPDLIRGGNAGEFADFIQKFEGPPDEPAAPAMAFAGPPYPIVPIVPISLTQNGKHLVWRLFNTSTKDYQIDVNVYGSGQKGEQLFQSGIEFPYSFPNKPTYYRIKSRQSFDFNLSVADITKNTPHYDNSPASPTHIPGSMTVTTTTHKVAAVVTWIVL